MSLDGVTNIIEKIPGPITATDLVAIFLSLAMLALCASVYKIYKYSSESSKTIDGLQHKIDKTGDDIQKLNIENARLRDSYDRVVQDLNIKSDQLLFYSEAFRKLGALSNIETLATMNNQGQSPYQHSANQDT